MPQQHSADQGRGPGLGPGSMAVEFVLMLAFWLAISGQYNVLFIAMGVVSAALVTWFTHRYVAANLGRHTPPSTIPLRWARSIAYVLWLLARIPPAGVLIAWVVLQPRLPVEPYVLRFTTHLESPVARTTLANSITLVPGTLTLDVDPDTREFTVHAFVPSAADDLVSGEMQNRIARLFLQDPAPPPEVVWEPAAEEVPRR